MSDPIGRLVEYIEKNRIVVALVHGTKKSRLSVLTPTEKQVVLAQSRVLLLTSSRVSPEKPRSEQTEYMLEVNRRREELSSLVDVPQLWELVNEEDPMPLADLAELSFGGQVNGDHLSATLRALFYEKLHFRLAGKEFIPLSQEQLEQKQLQLEREANHRKEVDSAVAHLKSLANQNPIEAQGCAPEGLFDMLRDLVVFEEEAPQVKKAKEIVSLAEIGGRRRLFDLLVSQGVLSPHENLPLLREELQVDFSSELMGYAVSLSPDKALEEKREDLTGLFTFTIDGINTTDFDDALSFEPDPSGGGLLGVHITEVASVLGPDDPLDEEARLRGSTIYMPDIRIPMLPPALSEDALSLRQGRPRPAISLLARVDEQGIVSDFRLVRSVISVHQRLTYEEADELITNTDPFKSLHACTKGLGKTREADGAYYLPLPEVIVGLDDNQQVWVARVDRDSPAREMVAETAILANQLKARYLLENNIPALFRTQAPPKESFKQGPASDIFLHFSQRRLLNRVEITTKPGLHSSLGVEPYTHVTSPIRRYLDLVMQRQLGAALAGQMPVYTKQELKDLAMEVGPNVRRGFKVRQARQRYWLLTWLKNHKDEPRKGIVMEQQLKRWQILLPEIMMLASVPIRREHILKPGMPVQVHIEKVDPFDDVLRVSVE